MNKLYIEQQREKRIERKQLRRLSVACLFPLPVYDSGLKQLDVIREQ